VRISGPGLPTTTWTIGNVAPGADRVTLQNTAHTKRPSSQFRILAAKANVVVDLGVFAEHLTSDLPQAIATEMLARIPG
jgi:hypothetical protein